MDDIIDLIKNLGVVLAVVFYLAIVLWTYKDARKRMTDPILIATATAVSMLPIVGVLVYMLLRPSEYLADVRERELEIRMMERELGRQERCPYCKSHIDGDYLSCPVCTTKLRQSCTGCEKPLDPRWVMCPFCETEVPGRGGRPTPGPAGGKRTNPNAGGRERSKPSSSSSSRSASSPSTKSSPAASPTRESRSSSSASSKREDIRVEPLAPGSDS
ncbi:MAG: hypothetical protein JWM25_1465 [Thermoleophilia bacterium]|nr:hypothetical protein [Thermoleophilia bacterium]MCZ4496880.1 hypothetical protein [Thermoleophilia bacterium]